MEYVRDLISEQAIVNEKEEAQEKAEKKGREEGKKIEKLEIAKNLLWAPLLIQLEPICAANQIVVRILVT